METTLKVAPERAAARVGALQIRGRDDLAGRVLLSALPNLPFLYSDSISPLSQGEDLLGGPQGGKGL
jgi:hypothetical protein